jgi:glucokinase
MSMKLLAGDIGGTKTNLAVVTADSGPGEPLVEKTLPSADYPSLEALIADFLDETGVQVQRASFGVAGPVVAGRASTTNLPWVIEETQLAVRFELKSVALLNDLAATAYAVPNLSPADLHTLHAGEPVQGGPVAVLAPGWAKPI